jgi:hypothetical protein
MFDTWKVEVLSQPDGGEVIGKREGAARGGLKEAGANVRADLQAPDERAVAPGVGK